MQSNNDQLVRQFAMEYLALRKRGRAMEYSMRSARHIGICELLEFYTAAHNPKAVPYVMRALKKLFMAKYKRRIFPFNDRYTPYDLERVVMGMMKNHKRIRFVRALARGDYDGYFTED